jgi:RNA recognition motif-containing protein
MGLDGQQHQQQEVHGQSNSKKKPVVRAAAGKVWVDPTLSEWPENDFRIFVGNLSGDVSEQQFLDFFQSKYASVARAKIVCDAKGMSKGYGFVSFLQPLDCAKAIREQDQKWLGSRPIRVKRSDWKDRNFSHVQKQQKKEKKRQRR